MAYMALYRKWRPQDFSDLVGQEHISKTLSNAITSEKIAHAYLFSGPRGTGKTSTAKILAKALNCQHGPTPFPCNKCGCCEKINDGSFMDVFEIDAASNRGIDEIRDLRETVKFAPADGRYKVYIIDEVHMLTTEAFNALLKTLEEPPEHVVFILATTEVHKVPITIQSRCQRYDFKRITKDDILGRLEKVVSQTQLKADREALEIIAVQADGGMRDALSLLDQCLAFSKDTLDAPNVKKVLGLVGHDWIWKLTDAVIGRNAAEILTDLNEIIAQGKEIKQIFNEFALHLRSLMIYKAADSLLGLDMYLEDEAVLKKQSDAFSHERLSDFMRETHNAANELKWSFQPRITAEMLFLKLCRYDEIAGSEAKAKNGAAPASFAQSPGSAVPNAKIAALEQKTARMERIIKALSTQLTNLSEQMTASALPAQQTRAEYPGKNTFSRSASFSGANTDGTGQNAPPSFSSSSPPAPAISLHDADAAAVWQNVLNGLKTRRKIVVAACVNKAVPYKITENQFFIHFESPFLQARTQKDDYRLLIEDVLKSVTGCNLRLMCTTGGAVPAAAPEPIRQVKPQIKISAPLDAGKPSADTAQNMPVASAQAKPPAPEGDFQYDVPMPTDDDYVAEDPIDYGDLTPEGRHTLKTAIEIFGAKAVPEDEIGDIKSK